MFLNTPKKLILGGIFGNKFPETRRFVNFFTAKKKRFRTWTTTQHNECDQSFLVSTYWFPDTQNNEEGYVYTSSDIFRSIWDRIHYDTDPLCLHETGSKLEQYGSIWDHLHKWTHLVPDSRSDPYRIIRSRVNTRLIHTDFVPVPNGSGQCKRCLNKLGFRIEITSQPYLNDEMQMKKFSNPWTVELNYIERGI